MAKLDENSTPETVISNIYVGKPPEGLTLPVNETSTSRILWLAGYGILMTTVAIRLPLIYQRIAHEVPADATTKIGDERLLSFSLTAGLVIFFLVYSLIMALFFSLLALLDKKLIPSKAKFLNSLSVGPYFVIAVLTTVPVNAVSIAFNVVQPRDLTGYWFYFPIVAILTLTIFRHHWLHLPLTRKILIITSTMGLSLVNAFG